MIYCSGERDLRSVIFGQEGELVPSMPIPLERWEDLLSKANIHQRKQYYYFLYDLEIVKERKKLSKKLFREQQEECRNSLPTKSAWEMDEHRMVYGICGNTLFLQLRHTTEHSFYENRLIQAMKFGPAIVIDCGYDHCMDTRESRAQIWRSIWIEGYHHCIILLMFSMRSCKITRFRPILYGQGQKGRHTYEKASTGSVS
ncbi:unnamed protein product [Allacma fusca]|uniref:Uncharacterized protein n=1 Tax=Allacma fusca TaxID=39272 RepID=A0A8J2NT04_9HEXA|nr:unnamed protein product [Allacma fusca]